MQFVSVIYIKKYENVQNKTSATNIQKYKEIILKIIQLTQINLYNSIYFNNLTFEF